MRFSHLFYLEYIRTKPNEPTRIEWRKYKNKLKNDYGYEQENSKLHKSIRFFLLSVCRMLIAQMLKCSMLIHHYNLIVFWVRKFYNEKQFIYKLSTIVDTMIDTMITSIR